MKMAHKNLYSMMAMKKLQKIQNCERSLNDDGFFLKVQISSIGKNIFTRKDVRLKFSAFLKA